MFQKPFSYTRVIRRESAVALWPADEYLFIPILFLFYSYNVIIFYPGSQLHCLLQQFINKNIMVYEYTKIKN